MKTYIISMNDDNGRKRMTKLQKQLDMYPQLRVEKFDAVDGKKISKEQLKEKTTRFCQRFCTPSIVGIAMSHMEIWKKIANGSDDVALIFEDDVYLYKDFYTKAMQKIQQAGEFDLLFLGCILCDPKDTSDPYGIRSSGDFAGTHCYAMTKKGAQKIISEIKKISWHIDVQVSQIYRMKKSLNIKISNEKLATQEGSGTSSNSVEETAFPESLHHVLRNVDMEDKIDYSLIATMKHFRVGGYNNSLLYVDGMTVFFFILFLVLGMYYGLKTMSPYVVAFIVADIIISNNSKSKGYHTSFQRIALFSTVGYIIGRAFG